MQRIEADRLPPTPWRNGGGSTRELFAGPSVASWQVRVSLADIEQDGPFSAFPGVQRFFAVLEGAGVVLGWPEGEQQLTVDSPPCRFDGAAAPACRLVQGPTRDLNLMLRRGLGGTMVAVADALPCALPWPWRAVFCAGPARLTLAGGDVCVLAARTLVLDLPAGAHSLQRLDVAPAFWLGAQLGADGMGRASASTCPSGSST